MISDNIKEIDTNKAFFSSEKYLAKTIRNLDLILKYFCTKYGIQIPDMSFTCNRLIQDELTYFKITKQMSKSYQ